MSDEMFILVEASKLSMDDEFMQHQPKVAKERELKKELENVIQEGVADFYRPKMDPAFDEAGNICFKAGLMPAVGKSYDWWRKNAGTINPERWSRLGTKKEYIAFLGVLLKELIASGWTLEDAWEAVCVDSEKLGHYWNSNNAKHDFEVTGSREVCGFYDLANTCKFLENTEEENAFWLVGGNCYYFSYVAPIYGKGIYFGHAKVLSQHVGGIVFEC